MTRGRRLLITAALGLALGFVISQIGFSSWDEVHRMFVFADLRMFLTFVGATALLVPFWIVMQKRQPVPRRRFHPGIVPGGLLFGAGWALCGACPAIALVQIGEGQLGGAWTLLGILVGSGLYVVAHRRWFRWSIAACGE